LAITNPPCSAVSAIAELLVLITYGANLSLGSRGVESELVSPEVRVSACSRSLSSEGLHCLI